MNPFEQRFYYPCWFHAFVDLDIAKIMFEQKNKRPAKILLFVEFAIYLAIAVSLALIIIL